MRRWLAFGRHPWRRDGAVAVALFLLPGVVIGKKGADIEKLRKKVAELTASDAICA